MYLEQLHGIWEITSICSEGEDGARNYPFGEEPTGRLTYHPEGYMSAFIGRPDRENFAGDVGQGTMEEIKAAFESFQAYCGRFSLDLEGGVIIHHVTIARVPNYEGTDLVRYFTLEDDTLQLRTAPFQFQGQTAVLYINWKKVV